MKRLYKSKTDRVISGVCSGIANYLDVDPTLVRVVLVICILLGGIGILAYIVAIFIIPERPITTSSTSEQKIGDVFESNSDDNDKLHS
ncbi:MAG: PspC domain-containing protein [Caldisericia bacterium]|nr:PspC domain-containing protein [Caldisericia bacterium]